MTRWIKRILTQAIPLAGASALAVVLVLTAPAGPAAAASEPVQQHNSNALWFENWGGLTNATLKVIAPGGQITELFVASGTPVYQLPSRDVLDGVYTYELSAAMREQEAIVNPINNGRGDAARTTAAKSFHAWGSFVVSRGVIITPEDLREDDSQ